MEPQGSQKGTKGSPKGAKGRQKGAKSEPRGDQNASKNPPTLGRACQTTYWGEVYLPLPPPPWGLRRQTLVPIGLKTLYTYIGSTFWLMGTKSCAAGFLALWVQFWQL